MFPTSVSPWTSWRGWRPRVRWLTGLWSYWRTGSFGQVWFSCFPTPHLLTCRPTLPTKSEWTLMTWPEPTRSRTGTKEAPKHFAFILPSFYVKMSFPELATPLLNPYVPFLFSEKYTGVTGQTRLRYNLICFLFKEGEKFHLWNNLLCGTYAVFSSTGHVAVRWNTFN